MLLGQVDQVTQHLVHSNRKAKMPKISYFIYAKVFGDHFVLMTVRCLYFRYLVTHNEYNESEARVLLHSFFTVVYLSTLPGGILAELIGSFKAILFTVIVYMAGLLYLAVAAFFVSQDRTPTVIAFFIFGAAIGAQRIGLHSLARDQLKTPSSEHKYLTLLYIVTIIAAFTAYLVAPILIEIQCFEQEECFPLAFGLNFILVFITTIIFFIGTKYFIKDKNSKIYCLKFVNASVYSFCQKLRSSEYDTRESWLDYGETIYDKKFLDSLKELYKGLPILITVPMFWALFDQQLSLFLLQAYVMNNRLYTIKIYPELIFVLHPIITSIVLPIFIYGIFPLMDKIKMVKTELNRMAFGLILAVLAYAVATFLEAYIENSRFELPTPKTAGLVIYNGCKHNISVQISSERILFFVVPSLDYITHTESLGTDKKHKSLDTSVTVMYPNNVNYSAYTALTFFERKITQYFVYTEKYPEIKVKIDGPHIFPHLSNIPDSFLSLLVNINHKIIVLLKGPEILEVSLNSSVHFIGDLPITDGVYEIKVNDLKSLKFRVGIGGIYVLFIVEEEGLVIQTLTLSEENYIHIFWLIPQMFLLVSAEIFITNNCLSYLIHKTQHETQTIVTVLWLLTIGFGNLIVTLDAAMELCCERKLYVFLQYTCLMLLNTGAHVLLASSQEESL